MTDKINFDVFKLFKCKSGGDCLKHTSIYMSIILSILFILSIFCYGNQVQAADSIDDRGIKSNVEANKSWMVKFNKELDKDTIGESNFIVKDENGQLVPINIVIGSDNKSVTIFPKSQYSYGKTYSLTVSNIKSSSGKKLQQSVKMQFSTKSSTNENNCKYTVCIDAGHGGDDAGNVSTSGIKEKDIDLSVALKAGKILENNGVKVVYTRNSDTVSWSKDTELKSRFDSANNANANYFVSIHCNTYTENTSAKGIETYYRASDNVSKQLAQAVQSELISQTGSADRGIKEGLSQHKILTGTAANAIMVELGFMSNPNESSILATTDFQDKSANSIANGILKSLSLINTNVNISSISDLSASITQGDSYSLPTNVSASMSDGSKKNIPVTWNSTKIDTSSAGTFTYVGTAVGYDKPVKLILTVAAKPAASDSSTTICLDPGHGMGSDTGATGINSLQEDDVTLAVGLKLGKILEDHGIKVVYTRTEDERSTPMDVTSSLQKRCDISNDANAKYFVCIHCNSFDDDSVNGTETWHNPENEQSVKLAQAIQNSIVQELGTNDRKIKNGYNGTPETGGRSLYVIRNTNAPAVLVELGFLTNPTDAEKLSSDDYRQKFAQAIADGILQCLGK